MVELGQILLLAAVVIAAWLILSPKPVFKMRVAQGSLKVTRGKVTYDRQQQAAEILRQWQIRRGWVARSDAAKASSSLFPTASHPVAASNSGTCGRTARFDPEAPLWCTFANVVMMTAQMPGGHSSIRRHSRADCDANKSYLNTLE